MTSSFLNIPHEVKPPGQPLNQLLQPAVLCPHVFRSSAAATGAKLCVSQIGDSVNAPFITRPSQGLQQMSKLIE